MALTATKQKRYYRKNVDFFKLVTKLKLWPSRSGKLHGIKSMKIIGNTAEITTHCNETFLIQNSKHSRAARCLRNKLFFHSCRICKIPQWKLEKYAGTYISQSYGATL